MRKSMERRKSLIERYKRNTSRYTNVHNFMDILLTIVVVLTLIQVFVWDRDSLLSLIFEIFSFVFWIAYAVILILDVRGRLKIDS